MTIFAETFAQTTRSPLFTTTLNREPPVSGSAASQQMQLSQVPLRLELNHFVFLRRWLQRNAGSALKRGGRIESKGPKALPRRIVECGIPQQTVP